MDEDWWDAGGRVDLEDSWLGDEGYEDLTIASYSHVLYPSSIWEVGEDFEAAVAINACGNGWGNNSCESCEESGVSNHTCVETV